MYCGVASMAKCRVEMAVLHVLLFYSLMPEGIIPTEEEVQVEKC